MTEPNNIAKIIYKIKDLTKAYQLNDQLDISTELQKIFRKYPKAQMGLYKKSEVLEYYNNNVNDFNFDITTHNKFLDTIKMKNTRTISGVTPVTVLTKPFPCPGKCIFCPNDVKMPKSYLRDEPGAQRALRNKFDPYLQTFNRLLAYKNIGHPTEKIELIILGGTWTFYPTEYQVWFVKRCFDALNEFNEITSKGTTELDVNTIMPFDESKLTEIDGEIFNKSYNQIVSNAIKSIDKELETATLNDLFKAHKINENAKSRCVGLVVETRPDEITIDVAKFLRTLGATKIQIGIQSLNDEVLKLNKRGHDVTKTKEAINILRLFGFKIHAHVMPNLYGSTPKHDVSDYKKVFSDINIRPDEIKIYPCSLIKSAELMQIYKKDLWKPYTEEELMYVLTENLKDTPEYCRITRMIRDICSGDIVVGNKKTNFRQIAELNLKDKGFTSKDIRYREVKGIVIAKSELTLKIIEYNTEYTKELFLQFVTSKNLIAGFLRLSLPSKKTDNFKNQVYENTPELKDAAMIREIHVYGESVKVGTHKSGKAQHLGLGKSLIKTAKEISKEAGFDKLNVISSVGTREYYRKNGFVDCDLYQFCVI